MSTSRPSPLLPFLKRLSARSVLTTAEEECILSLPCREVQLRPNSDIVGIGETATEARMVVNGVMGRFDQNSRGERQIIALHIRGDMTDLLSVVQPSATCALQAVSAAAVVAVPHNAIRAAIARHPGLSEALWRDCVVDAMILAQWVVNVGRRSARIRIAHLFCEMACRYDAAPLKGQTRFQLALTQQQLGDATGLTPVHVNRTLMSLRPEGLVVRHRTVWIDDWQRLCGVAEFDGAYLQRGLEPAERVRLAA